MSKDLFSEIGNISKKIAVNLSKNQELARLIRYTDKTPLDKNKTDIDLIKDPLLHKNILIIPRVDYQELSESKISILVPSTSIYSENDDFTELLFYIDVFTKIDQWIIDDEEDILRPFKIMRIIKDAVHNKRLGSIGTVRFQNFDTDIINDDVTCHRMLFVVSANG